MGWLKKEVKTMKPSRIPNSTRLNLARFDLQSLRLVVLVAHYGSLSLAAQHMPLALAAASRRLRELESTLGQPLFVRQSHGMQVSDAGELVVRHACEVLHSLDMLGDSLKDIEHGVTRHIRLCASSAAIVQFLPPLIARFEHDNPKVRIELEEQVSDVVVMHLRQGRADVGVFASGAPEDGLNCESLRQDELVVVLPNKHRLARSKAALTFADLLNEPWVSLSAGAALLNVQVQAAARLNTTLKIRMQVRSFDAMAQLIAAGLGIGLMPRLAVQPMLTGRLVTARPLRETWAKRQLWVATRPETTEPAVSAFVASLRQPLSEA
jgi:DNA-binding transcriptional LysR family regulator